MVTDRQMRRLMSLLQTEQSLQVSADKAGMDCKTARKYRKSGQLPSALRTDHDWRTRADPFVAVWPWVVEQLSLSPSGGRPPSGGGGAVLTFCCGSAFKPLCIKGLRDLRMNAGNVVFLLTKPDSVSIYGMCATIGTCDESELSF